MAEFDEGPSTPSTTKQVDDDISDETQDFRFLTDLSLTTEHPTLPRRGEKDFEPHGTASQQDVLASSRAAMHNALCHPRIHAPKSCISGAYDSCAGTTLVDNPKGQHFRTMGKADAFGQLHLLPEEALYLLERGNLDLRCAEAGEEGGAGMPFSLQMAYTTLVGRLGLTLERFTVYAGLKRSGYVVQRGPAWNVDDPEFQVETRSQKERNQLLGFQWMYAIMFKSVPKEPPRQGPLIGRCLFRSYDEIYRRIAMIPFYDPSQPSRRGLAGRAPWLELRVSRNHSEAKRMMPEKESRKPLRCSFYVWKPGPGFKKSSPGPPDFRIVIMNAREDAFPILEQLDELLQTVPYDPAPWNLNTQPYQKVKHGWRNVILAVVDQGVVSYLRVGDAGFGNERLYERPVRGRGGKRGGGRGRGRGGRGLGK